MVRRRGGGDTVGVKLGMGWEWIVIRGRVMGVRRAMGGSEGGAGWEGKLGIVGEGKNEGGSSKRRYEGGGGIEEKRANGRG